MNCPPLLPPCPSWCGLEPDHDSYGTDREGRIHRPGVQVLEVSERIGLVYDDLPTGLPWYLDVDPDNHYVGTANEVIAHMRSLATELSAAAAWLEAQVAR